MHHGCHGPLCYADGFLHEEDGKDSSPFPHWHQDPLESWALRWSLGIDWKWSSHLARGQSGNHLGCSWSPHTTIWRAVCHQESWQLHCTGTSVQWPAPGGSNPQVSGQTHGSLAAIIDQSSYGNQFIECYHPDDSNMQGPVWLWLCSSGGRKCGNWDDVFHIVQFLYLLGKGHMTGHAVDVLTVTVSQASTWAASMTADCSVGMLPLG